jgi:hypothetical protein
MISLEKIIGSSSLKGLFVRASAVGLAAACIVGCSANARPDYRTEHSIYSDLEPPIDVNKDGSEAEINLCYAAAAANSLTWAGWAPDEDQVYQDISERFGNTYTRIRDALEFYFSTRGLRVEEIYREEYRPGKLAGFIMDQLMNDNPVTIQIREPDTDQSTGQAHYLNIWGYAIMESNSQEILRLFGTDSNFHRVGIEIFDFQTDDALLSKHRAYKDWVISHAASIIRPDELPEDIAQ